MSSQLFLGIVTTILGFCGYTLVQQRAKIRTSAAAEPEPLRLSPSKAAADRRTPQPGSMFASAKLREPSSAWASYGATLVDSPATSTAAAHNLGLPNDPCDPVILESRLRSHSRVDS